jgi:hypothetical protein
MRASPACQVSLQRVDAWQAAVCVLVLGTAAVLTAWALTRSVPITPGAWAGVGFTLLLTFAFGASLWRVPVQSLRWDGRAWQLDSVAGELSVAIDLGPWMLLVFTPASRPGRSLARVSWLPFQRRGLELQWHALRCAVYSPRPPAEA